MEDSTSKTPQALVDIKTTESRESDTSDTKSYSMHFISDITSEFPLQLTSHTPIFLCYVYPIKY